MVALGTAYDADTLPLSLTFRNAGAMKQDALIRQKWNKLAFIAVNQYHLHVLNSKIGLHMIRKWLAAALIACSFQAFSLQDTADLEASSSHYIRDDLFIFMHTGPGRNYRILGSIEAGTPITVLARDNDAEFTQITDNEGREGWVESRFVSNTMSQALTKSLGYVAQKPPILLNMRCLNNSYYWVLTYTPLILRLAFYPGQPECGSCLSVHR